MEVRTTTAGHGIGLLDEALAGVVAIRRQRSGPGARACPKPAGLVRCKNCKHGPISVRARSALRWPPFSRVRGCSKTTRLCAEFTAVAGREEQAFTYRFRGESR